MSYKDIIEFFKEIGFYNEKLFTHLKLNTIIVDKSYEEVKEFVGCYPIYRNNLLDCKIILPKIKSIDDCLLYVHEYSHALFLEDDNEIFPNIMEALFLKKIYDKIPNYFLNKTIEEINHSISIKHTIGKKVKLMYLK